MPERESAKESVLARIDLSGCEAGPVLQPLVEKSEQERKAFDGWETPLAPWGGFRTECGLEIVEEDGRNVLAFTGRNVGWDRALVTAATIHDCRIVADVKPVDADARPNPDNPSPKGALVGIVFRVRTSRSYYQFGIESRRRAVLYRRNDDEWIALAEADIDVSDGYLTLEVELDEDAMHCRCEQLGVDFFCTDAAFKTGKVGVRSCGASMLVSLSVTQTPSQRAEDERRAGLIEATEKLRGQGIPEPVEVRTFDLAELGGSPEFADFAVEGRFDMLVQTERSLRALTCEGEVLWEFPEPLWHVEMSEHQGEDGRLLYALAGARSLKDGRTVVGKPYDEIVNDQLVLIRGADGKELARTRLPDLSPSLRQVDLSDCCGALTGQSATDIVLREWDSRRGGGGTNLWAYDSALNLLWHQEQTGAWYGHHWAVRFCDVDADGRDELLAGGMLYDCSGNLLWVHDRNDEMQRVPGAQHYDAVAIGRFAGDDAIDPVAFLLGGSGGVYVVDALTGRTRAFHRTGHAQGQAVGRWRADMPGKQVLAAMRWGNMGILTLFSGRGERLWTIQPDYIGQGACAVTWPGAEAQLIWTCTTAHAQAFYDGYGRRVRRLGALQRVYGERMRKDVATTVIKTGNDPKDYLALSCDGVMHVFGPES